MPQGLSLHIGLNGVDPSKYNGWAGTLAGCINDANAMEAIAQAQGFTSTKLLDADATADGILCEIGKAAHALQSGDSFFLSYSGHGGQVPDANGDEDDGLDETWVAYDRMIVDDELYGLWAQFAAGVRIQVYSDSCHSGSVIRDLILPNGTFASPGPSGKATKKAVPAVRETVALTRFNTVFHASPRAEPSSASVASSSAGLKAMGRAIPPTLALQLYSANRSFYSTRQFTNKRSPVDARVVLISGCQDNQTSQDGQVNGLFTEKLLSVWNDGGFCGTLVQLHKAILALMPAAQTPNYFVLGAEDPDFDAARPMTIVASSSSVTPVTPTSPASSTPVSPSITGPATCDREGMQPTFSVALGSNPYYIVEITSDTENFGNTANRTNENFYATWADADAQARMTSPTYTLPQAAWDALKGNDSLYYRVGSTSSQTGWDDYLVSTSDADAASSAPSIAITGSKSASRSAPGELIEVY